MADGRLGPAAAKDHHERQSARNAFTLQGAGVVEALVEVLLYFKDIYSKDITDIRN